MLTAAAVLPAADIDLTQIFALHELALKFSPCEFRIKWADCSWERHQAHLVRRAVFCEEQGIFDGDDRDEIDDRAQSIVALACVAGEADAVVGTVRIHQAAPAEWWGSRLAVSLPFRSHGRLGATLIRLAVSSAHARGCNRFLAHVQAQNVPLFRRLRWRSLEQLHIHGREHHLMQADLNHYPPCATPYAGFVARSIGQTP
jgi:putative N-acetyltransferase (TIGR04045 family)